MSGEELNGKQTLSDEKILPLRLLALFTREMHIDFQISYEGRQPPSSQDLADDAAIQSHFLSGKFGGPSTRVVGRYNFINGETKDLMNTFRASEALSAEEKAEVDESVFDATFAIVLAGQELFFAAIALAKSILILTALAGLILALIAIYHQIINPEHIPPGLLIVFDAVYICAVVLCLSSTAATPFLLRRILPGTLLPRLSIAEFAPWLSQIQMWLFLVVAISVGVLTYPHGLKYHQTFHFHSASQVIRVC